MCLQEVLKVGVERTQAALISDEYTSRPPQQRGVDNVTGMDH
jgi:hypothetical protein